MCAVITVTDHKSGGAPCRGYPRHRRQWPRPGRLRRPGGARHQRWRPVPGASPRSPLRASGVRLPLPLPSPLLARLARLARPGRLDSSLFSGARPAPDLAAPRPSRSAPPERSWVGAVGIRQARRSFSRRAVYGSFTPCTDAGDPAIHGQSAHFSPSGTQTGAPTPSPFRLNPIPGTLNSATVLITRFRPGPGKCPDPLPRHGRWNGAIRFTERPETVLDPHLTGHPDSKWHSCIKSHRQLTLGRAVPKIARGVRRGTENVRVRSWAVHNSFIPSSHLLVREGNGGNAGANGPSRRIHRGTSQ